MDKLSDILEKVVGFRLWTDAIRYFTIRSYPIKLSRRFNENFLGSLQKILVLSLLIFVANVTFWRTQPKEFVKNYENLIGQSLFIIIATGFVAFYLTSLIVQVFSRSTIRTRQYTNFLILHLVTQLSIMISLNLTKLNVKFYSHFLIIFGKNFTESYSSELSLLLWALTCSTLTSLICFLNSVFILKNPHNLRRNYHLDYNKLIVTTILAGSFSYLYLAYPISNAMN